MKLGLLGADSFREMAKEAIGSDQKLQIDILNFLCNYNDCAEALHFAQFYSIPKSQWPWYLTDMKEGKCNYVYLSLYLSYHIHFVRLIPAQK